MAQLTDLPLEFDVVGAGFDETECRRLAADLGVASRVNFHGQVPRDAVAEFYRRADIFVFPSYREPGGTAPYEALSFGLPVIAADRGGPAVAVTPECGIVVTPRDPESYAAELATAVRRLAADEELRRALGRGARERAAAVAVWEPRIERMERLYAEVLGIDSLP
jgi:glycosyltransferase involved in cell wall biosynthesis